MKFLVSPEKKSILLQKINAQYVQPHESNRGGWVNIDYTFEFHHLLSDFGVR